MDIKFNVGDLITVNGTHFMVAGRIDYSAKDKGQWSEFFLVRLSDKVGFWMSVDDKVLLWEPLKNSDLTGYEKVEEGDETVDAVAGYVDCESGDSAEYEDYFNSADNTYVSIEKWSDGTEKSKGVLVDPSQIVLVKKGDAEEVEASEDTEKKGKSKSVWKYLLLIFAVFLGFKFCGSSSSSSSAPSIESGLSENSNYSDETYLTGADKEFAQVYSSNMGSVESVAKDIITHIEGNTSMIYENPVDSASVMIITPDEFCMVYVDTITNKTLVHVCKKNWIHKNSEIPLYHASASTDMFAKSWHIFKTYGPDSLKKSSDSHYHHHRSFGSFFTGYFFGTAMNNRYSDYSNSVRQSSVSSRSSSGGGHGGWGK